MAEGCINRPLIQSRLIHAIHPPWEYTLFLIEESLVLGVELGDGTWVPGVQMCYMRGEEKQTPSESIMALNSVRATYHLLIFTYGMSHLFTQANVKRLYGTYHQGDEQCLLCS